MAEKPTNQQAEGSLHSEHYNFLLGALARIAKKVDMLSESLQDVKVDLIHIREDIDETRADVSELRQRHSVPASLAHSGIGESEVEFDL